MMIEKIVIIGGGQASLSCASQLRSLGFKGEIIVPTLTWISDIVSVTENGSTWIDLENTSASNLSYLWSTGDTTSSINVGPGTYYVTAFSGGCNIGSDTIIVQSASSATVDIGTDLQICDGEQVIINPIIVGGTAPYIYNWSNGSTSSSIIVNNFTSLSHISLT